jgi:hypothetical protein
MGDFIVHLIELVAEIWHTDSKIRHRSLFGESKMERQSGRFIALLCGGFIALLVIAGMLCFPFESES